MALSAVAAEARDSDPDRVVLELLASLSGFLALVGVTIDAASELHLAQRRYAFVAGRVLLIACPFVALVLAALRGS